MRTIRLATTAAVITALIAGAGLGAAPASAAPSWTKCARLLPPDAAALMGAPAVLVSESTPTAPFGRVASSLEAVRGIAFANGARTCVWRFGTTTVTLSVMPVTAPNRIVIDKAWWNVRGVDGINTGGTSTLYVSSGATESGYLIDEPYYLTTTTTDATHFPAFLQLAADRLHDLV